METCPHVGFELDWIQAIDYRKERPHVNIQSDFKV